MNLETLDTILITVIYDEERPTTYMKNTQNSYH